MKRERGRQGEDEAVRYLRAKGYRILERNYRSRFGEIDIICEHRGMLIFVEVRAKTSDRFGEPEESITRQKMDRIRKTAFTYIAECGDHPRKPIRFDFIGIRLDPEGARINHIQSAF